MSDSNIVVACHCKVHEQLYHVKPNGEKGTVLGDGAIYIDPYTCPENPWSSVKEASADFVWGENCSVYTQLTNGLQITKKGKIIELKDSHNNTAVHSSRILFRILDESYRVLKVGGRAIFGDFDKITNSLKTKVSLINAHPEISPRYTVELVPAAGYDLHLAQNYNGKLFRKTYLYVFTKKPPVPEGEKGGRRTRKYRQKRNKTYKIKH